MKLFLTTLLLSSFIVANAQPGGSGALGLYGCFHNGRIYSTTTNSQFCPSLAPHTHDSISSSQNTIVTNHYSATGMISIMPNSSKVLSPSYTSIKIQPANYQVGNPDCILRKMPIGQ